MAKNILITILKNEIQPEASQKYTGTGSILRGQQKDKQETKIKKPKNNIPSLQKIIYTSQPS